MKIPVDMIMFIMLIIHSIIIICYMTKNIFKKIRLKNIKIPGIGEAEFGQQSKECSACPNVKDIYLIIIKTVRTAVETTKIKNTGILCTQMRYIEQKLQSIKEIAINVYLNELKQITNDKEVRLTSRNDYKNYLKDIKIILPEIKDIIKYSLMDETLYNEEQQIQEFTLDHANKIKDYISGYFDNFYILDTAISRKRLHQILIDLYNQLDLIMIEIYTKVKIIKKEKIEIIKKYDTELDEFIISKIGELPK